MAAVVIRAIQRFVSLSSRPFIEIKLDSAGSLWMIRRLRNKGCHYICNYRHVFAHTVTCNPRDKGFQDQYLRAVNDHKTSIESDTIKGKVLRYSSKITSTRW